ITIKKNYLGNDKKIRTAGTYNIKIIPLWDLEFKIWDFNMNIILPLSYLIGSITFIMGLKMLSHPDTARKGNMVAAVGMTIAIFATIFLYRFTPEGATEPMGLGNYGWIFGGLIIGTVAGTMMAKKVQMTAMPEMVSLFNGMGGACAMLISIVEYNHLQH